jgi:hypothetical protein
MLRILLSLLALAALGITFAPATAQQGTAPAKKSPPQQKLSVAKDAVAGTWSGSVRQQGHAKPYSLAMTIHDKGGDTDYPDLACGGRLTRVGSAGGYTFFLETITRGRLDKGGRCIDGSITVSMAGEKLSWGWVGTHEAQTIVASGTLDRR